MPLYDYWREPDGAYLVMRWLRGGSLQAALADGPLSLETAVSIIEQIASALTVAHRNGVVHRDVKPANILLDEDNNAYLSDFGIAKDNKQEMSQISPVSGNGASSAISPEQILNEPLTPLTDIYNLGLVLAELLTGENPFSGLSLAQIIDHCLHKSVPLVTTVRSELPQTIDEVIQRATARKPADRFPDALAFAAALRHAARLAGASHVSILAERVRTELVNPYKGLQAFQEADAEVFNGRFTFIQQLQFHLAQTRFLAVVGPSGSGKSSVVKAGLIPALRQGAVPGSEDWFFVEMTPGTNPLAELETALMPIAVNPPPNLLEPLQKDGKGLLRVLQRILPVNDQSERSQVLLLIDQFEELFTLVEDEAVRQHFLDCLLLALRDPLSQLRIVVTLRADFYDRPLQYPLLAKLLRQHTELALPLTTDELKEAICNPAAGVGVIVEPQLVVAILADVQTQPGALPLLQYALTELFEQRQGAVMTLDAYQKMGGIAGALSRRADELYAALDENGRAATRQLFLRLVTLGEGDETPDTRRRVLRSELEALSVGRGLLPVSRKPLSVDREPITEYGLPNTDNGLPITEYGRFRLLTFDRDLITRSPTVEVAHESLLQAWPRLRGWLDESRADVRQQRLLASAAAEWQAANQDAGFLLRDARLDQFSGWAENSTVALTQQEQNFLAASQAARQERLAVEEARRLRELETAQHLADTERQRAEDQTRANRRLRWRAFLLAGVLFIAVVLAGAAFWAYQQSVENEHVAFSRELAAAALDNLDTDPELSALLALQGLNEAKTIEAQSALHTALPTLHLQRTLMGHTGIVSGVDVSPDGERLITASEDTTARMWDVDTGEHLLTFAGHEIMIVDLAYSPDGIHMATADLWGMAKVWNAQTGEELLTLLGHTEQINSIDYNDDGTRIITASNDTTVKIWDALTGKVLLTLKGHTDEDVVSIPGMKGVVDVRFSPDGKIVATCGGDGTIILWDSYSGQKLHTIMAHTSAVMAIAFSPDGTRLASASEDGTVKIWHVADGEEFGQQLLLITQDTYGLEFSPDGKSLATIGTEGHVYIWDMDSGQELLTLFGHTGIGRDVVFAPDGRFVITASEDSTAKIWDIEPGRELFTLVASSGVMSDVAYSLDGKQIVTAEADGSFSLWDSLTGKHLATLSGHYDLVSKIAFSPDGLRLASAGFDGTVKLWDLTAQQELFTLEGTSGPLWDVTFNPDGNLVAASGKFGKVEVWDSQTGQKVNEFTEHEDIVFGIAFSPDGHQLATASWDNTVKIWDYESGDVLHTFSADNAFFDVEFSPDGTRLAAGNRTGFVKVWDIRSDDMVEVATLTGHASGVIRLAFSPDGSSLATCGFDETVKVWQLDNPAAGQELTLSAHIAFVTGVEFSPDGNRLVSSSFDGTAQVYTLDLDELVALANKRVTRSLTEAECQRFLHVESCEQ